MLNATQLLQDADKIWEDSILPTLSQYIAIPNQSPQFDPAWEQHGYMEQAVTLLADWCKQHAVAGMQLEILRAPGRTPTLLIEVAGQTSQTVLMYGHLDKQPEMTGWREGLHAWQPKREGDKLYGRGGADDGYAVFAALTAIALLQAQQQPHPRCVILIEASEESGSPDLPYYLELIKPHLGTPALVIGLDSGCGNYDQLWCTTSLRGLISGNLTVEVLSEGVHSGNGSGVFPSSFRVLRELLDRLEDVKTGVFQDERFCVTIPTEVQAQAKQTAALLGENVYEQFPHLPGVQPVCEDLTELVLNRTWRPTLCITGVDDIPPTAEAGNVLRPKTTAKISLRLPPTLNAKQALSDLSTLLTQAPPYQAKVTFKADKAGTGWAAKPQASWLVDALHEASEVFFGHHVAYMGEGGSIPFMGMLGEAYPEAEFLITGVLGPHSNAHGPNEFLHIPTAKKLTASVAWVLAKLSKTSE